MKTDLGVCLFNLKAFIFTHPDPDHLTFQYPYTDPALRTWVLNSALETQRGTLQHSTALGGSCLFPGYMLTAHAPWLLMLIPHPEHLGLVKAVQQGKLGPHLAVRQLEPPRHIKYKASLFSVMTQLMSDSAGINFRDRDEAFMSSI